jgi:hypothetical protein
MKKLKLPTPIPDSGPPELTDAAEAPQTKKSRRHSKLPSVWQLLARSIKEYGQDWKAYAFILIIVALPSNILSLGAGNPNSTQSTQSVISAYTTFASVIMSVSLIYSIVQRHKTGKVPGPREAYYDGSAALVRFALVSAALVLYLIPFFIGVLIYGLGLEVLSASGVFGPEQLIFGGLALIFSIPSIFLITRYGLSTIVCVADGLRPVASLRASRMLTAGRFWVVLGRLAGLLVLAFVVAFVAFLVSYVNFANIPVLLFQLLATLAALPIGYLYLFNLYSELKSSIQPESYPTTESAQ